MRLKQITAEEYSELIRCGAWATSVSHVHKSDLEALGLLDRIAARPSDVVDYSVHLKDEYWAYFTKVG